LVWDGLDSLLSRESRGCRVFSVHSFVPSTASDLPTGLTIHRLCWRLCRRTLGCAWVHIHTSLLSIDHSTELQCPLRCRGVGTPAESFIRKLDSNSFFLSLGSDLQLPHKGRFIHRFTFRPPGMVAGFVLTVVPDHDTRWRPLVGCSWRDMSMTSFFFR
jgi:hypothetical protein